MAVEIVDAQRADSPRRNKWQTLRRTCVENDDLTRLAKTIGNISGMPRLTDRRFSDPPARPHAHSADWTKPLRGSR